MERGGPLGKSTPDAREETRTAARERVARSGSGGGGGGKEERGGFVVWKKRHSSGTELRREQREQPWRAQPGSSSRRRGGGERQGMVEGRQAERALLLPCLASPVLAAPPAPRLSSVSPGAAARRIPSLFRPSLRAGLAGAPSARRGRFSHSEEYEADLPLSGETVASRYGDQHLRDAPSGLLLPPAAALAFLTSRHSTSIPQRLVSAHPGPSGSAAPLQPPQPFLPSVRLHLGQEPSPGERVPLYLTAPSVCGSQRGWAAQLSAPEAPGSGNPACHSVWLRGWPVFLPVPLGHRLGPHNIRGGWRRRQLCQPWLPSSGLHLCFVKRNGDSATQLPLPATQRRAQPAPNPSHPTALPFRATGRRCGPSAVCHHYNLCHYCPCCYGDNTQILLGQEPEATSPLQPAKRTAAGG
uniref:PILR alpha-associated neural protein isoform X1 n=1 Tax=Podarcis muralis TaxID=64176 RepID=UPI00109F6872|nr:PILR alpha-associated neural protein isoform X1 [Podarcis muralis]